MLGSSVHGDSPGKNTGVGSHSLLHGIFPIQGLNPGLSALQMDSIAQLVKNPPAMQEIPVWDKQPTPVFLGFPCGSAGRESACNAEHLGSIPG